MMKNTVRFWTFEIQFIWRTWEFSFFWIKSLLSSLFISVSLRFLLISWSSLQYSLSFSLSSCLFSFIFSCLLVLSRLLLSCLVHFRLVLSSVVFSCLVSPLPSSLLSLSVFFLCYSPSLFAVLCCVCRCGRGVACVVWHAENPRVYTQNVPVHAGNTRTCVSTCTRRAGTHGDVLNVHTGTFWTDTAGKERVVVRSAYQNLPT